MLQIIDLENNELFSQIFSEESATVSGGGPVSGTIASLLALNTGLFNNATVQAAILSIIFNPTVA